MSTRKEILVIGRHPTILQKVLVLLNAQDGWRAQGFLSDEESIKFFSHEIDLVLLGGGVEETSVTHLQSIFKEINPDVKIVRHFGAIDLLLSNIKKTLN